ncbi:MAG: DUF4493 domain-containing protein [Rikenellaceae bacterium]
MNKRLSVLLLTLLAACSTDDSLNITMDEGMGRMNLSVEINDEVEASISTRAEESYSIPTDLVPESGDLKLSIYKRSGNNEDATSELYGEYVSLDDYDTPSMPVGYYTATVESGEGIDTESSTNAVFSGSVDFTVTDSEEAGQAAISASLANAIVSLQVTDAFNNYYAGGATLTLSTENGGEITIDFPNASSTDEILFVAPEAALYIAGTAVKQDPGTGTAPTVTFAKSKVGVATTGMMNNIIVDATETGGASITVTINDTITTVSTTTVDVNSGMTTTEE